ncbi:hypothetical protein PInf_022456 [Phytophthora infestans]|nr:hypothetical protein PInf_022456 [Phytophthora infestans]
MNDHQPLKLRIEEEMAFGRKVSLLQLAAVSSASLTLPTPTPPVVATTTASPPSVDPDMPPVQAVLDQVVPNKALDDAHSAAALEVEHPQVVPGTSASVVSEEEKKDPKDAPVVASGDSGIDELIPPQYIDALLADQRFGAVDADDINVCSEAVLCQEEAEFISDSVDAPGALPD